MLFTTSTISNDELKSISNFFDQFEKEIETSPLNDEVSKENEVKDDYFFDNESEEFKDEQ